MNMQIMVYPYNGKLLNSRKELTVDKHQNMGKSQKTLGCAKKPATKDNTM